VTGFAGAWAPDTPADAHVQWVRASWEAIRPFSTGGNYVNFQMPDDDSSRTASAYGRNYRRLQRVKAHFGASKKAQFISHQEAEKMPPLKIAIDAMSGRPGQGELGLLNWRPGGGNSWFLPGTPMQGQKAGELDRLARGIYDEHGMDFMVMHVASARFARGLHVLVWNRADADENRRADACYRKLAAEFARRGVSVGRAPIDYQDLHAGMLMPEFRNACGAIKKALDPNGIIAPGKYGIG